MESLLNGTDEISDAFPVSAMLVFFFLQMYCFPLNTISVLMHMHGALTSSQYQGHCIFYETIQA